MIRDNFSHKRSILAKFKSKRGQTLVEYGLTLAIVCVVAISVLLSLGGQVKTVMTTIDRQLGEANSGGFSGTQTRGG